MTSDENRAIAQALLEAIGSITEPSAIAVMFVDDVVF